MNKFKAGDICVIIDDTHVEPIYKRGDICKIIRIHEQYPYRYIIKKINAFTNLWIYEEDLEFSEDYILDKKLRGL